MIEFDKFSCHRELVRIQREANFWAPVAFVLTARQYGEVVLPDAASGNCPDTPRSGAKKLSRCKEGMAWFLPSGYKFCELYECRGTRLIVSR